MEFAPSTWGGTFAEYFYAQFPMYLRPAPEAETCILISIRQDPGHKLKLHPVPTVGMRK